MRLFDSHAHLTDERFDEDREQLRAEMTSQGMRVMQCATSPDDLYATAALAEEHDIIYGAVGVHPHDAVKYSAEVERQIEKLASNKKIVAIGEIGLDYHYDYSPREVQRNVLEAQLELASRLNMPVSLHNREATADMLAILSNHDVKGVMHCFSGSVETAKILLDMGLYLGVGGTLTFKGASKPVQVVEYAPMDRILLETDSPYLAPVPYRGKRNVPAYTEVVAKRIAALKGKTPEEIAAQTWNNACVMLNIEV